MADVNARLGGSRVTVGSTSESIPSLPFRFERQMLEPLERALPGTLRLPAHRPCRILREVDLGRIVPDVLIGVWRGRAPAPVRVRAGYREAHILALLEAVPSLTAHEIASELFLDRAATDRALVRLKRHGAVVERCGCWAIANAWHSRFVEVVAVEAKLDRWRDALAQAAAYLEFANRSYVVLDARRVDAGRVMREAFASLGVGLLLLDGEELQLAVRALSFEPTSVRRVSAVDRLFNADAGRERFASRRPSLKLASGEDRVCSAQVPCTGPLTLADG
jgi:hypothetical protein